MTEKKEPEYSFPRRFFPPPGVWAVTSIGIIMALSAALGFFLGSFLDRKLGTSPWLMMVFSILGIAGGFIEAIRMIIQASKED